MIREGVEWRIGEDDPLSYRYGTAASGETMHEGNTGNTAKVEMGVEFLHGMLSALVEEVRQLRESMQAIEQRLGETGSVHAPSVTGNTSIVSADGDIPEASMKAQMGELGSVQAPSVPPVAMAPKVKVDKEEVLARIQQMRDKGLDSAQIAETLQAEGVPTLSAEAQLQAVVQILEHRAVQDGSEGDTSIISADGDLPEASMEAQSTARQTLAGGIPGEFAYSATRVLGKLCKRGHEWGHTGQSLLKKSNLGCPECDREKAVERRQRKREAQLVNG